MYMVSQVAFCVLNLWKWVSNICAFRVAISTQVKTLFRLLCYHGCPELARVYLCDLSSAISLGRDPRTCCEEGGLFAGLSASWCHIRHARPGMRLWSLVLSAPVPWLSFPVSARQGLVSAPVTVGGLKLFSTALLPVSYSLLLCHCSHCCVPTVIFHFLKSSLFYL